jgi:hypothetical protein
MENGAFGEKASHLKLETVFHGATPEWIYYYASTGVREMLLAIRSENPVGVECSAPFSDSTFF